MTPPLLQLDQLSIAYNPHSEWAVSEVSLTLKAGDRLGLVGESGCGKSTLGRAIMRLLPSQSQVQGDIQVEGKSVLGLSEEELQRFRGEEVALIFQDPMTRLDPLMTIGDHCVETLQSHQSLSYREAKDRAIAVLETVSIPASRWSQYPHEFSGGMRQRVAIALALLLNPKLIIADEPTTSLDVTVSAQILQELTRLCAEREMGLLLISHDLALVGEYCSEIAVMYQGKLIERDLSKQVLFHPQQEYTQSLLEAALHIHAIETKAVTTVPEKQPLLQVDDLNKHYSLESNLIQQLFTRNATVIKAVDGVNFKLYPGEILGLVGESGCGKSTLSRTILQLIKPTSGRVEFLGNGITSINRKSLRQLRQQMQMVFQDPHACLNPLMTVGESITDPLLIHGLETPKTAKPRVTEMLERVGLTPTKTYYSRYPGELSGGQQQRVAIARALITRPKLVICDEPVSMLDASVQAQVLQLMLDLKREFELTYLFITHDLWVARFLCDRIAVMNQGKIVELNTTHEIFTHPQHPYTQTLLAAAPLLAQSS